MRVTIAGSRTFSDYALLERKCDKIIAEERAERGSHEPIEILCGLAKGADWYGKKYGEKRGYIVRDFPANWNKFGKIAGYIRNEEMAKYAEGEKGIFIAF